MSGKAAKLPKALRGDTPTVSNYVDHSPDTLQPFEFRMV